MGRPDSGSRWLSSAMMLVVTAFSAAQELSAYYSTHRRNSSQINQVYGKFDCLDKIVVWSSYNTMPGFWWSRALQLGCLCPRQSVHAVVWIRRHFSAKFMCQLLFENCKPTATSASSEDFHDGVVHSYSHQQMTLF